jgi:hypothetical protein
MDFAKLFAAGRQPWRSVAGHFRLSPPVAKKGPLSPAASFIFLYNRSPAPSTKGRRWVEISDGLLFVTNQEVRTRMSLKL